MATQMLVKKHVINAIDPDASRVDPWLITGAVWVSLGATCDTANGSVTFRLVFSDDDDNMTGVSPSYTLTSSSKTSDWGEEWLGTPQPDSPLPTLSVSADNLRLKVDALTGTGSWSFSIQSFVPAS